MSVKYDKEHCKGFYMKLNKKTDADIIAVLEAEKNKQGYVKALIRRDKDGENCCAYRGTGKSEDVGVL